MFIAAFRRELDGQMKSKKPNAGHTAEIYSIEQISFGNLATGN